MSKKIERKEPPKEVRSLRKYCPVLFCLVAFTVAVIAGYKLLIFTDIEKTSAIAAPGAGILPVGSRAIAVAATGAQDIVYPVSMFEDGKARHFEQKTGDGRTVRYFVMRSTDGVIRAAFDAGVVCWREGKGYFQKDDVMVCRNCGRRFPSNRINDVTGGCNPAPLTRKVENGNVVIQAASLQEGTRLFGGRS